MQEYINLFLIIIAIVIIFITIIMYYQTSELFDKIYLKYGSSKSTDMVVFTKS